MANWSDLSIVFNFEDKDDAKRVYDFIKEPENMDSFDATIHEVSISELKLEVSGSGRWCSKIEEWQDLALNNNAQMDLVESEPGSNYYIESDEDSILVSDVYWCKEHILKDVEYFLDCIDGWFFEDEDNASWDNNLVETMLEIGVFNEREIHERFKSNGILIRDKNTPEDMFGIEIIKEE